MADPACGRHFNLYYLHWWTLTHFIFESPQLRARALELVQRGGGIEAFEELIGPLDKIQPEWHAYVRQLKSSLSGGELKKPRSLEHTNSLK